MIHGEVLPHIENAYTVVFETFRLLQACGFIPKISKCTLVPSTCIEILGVIVNSISMTVSLPKSKEIQILEMITVTLRMATAAIYIQTDLCAL